MRKEYINLVKKIKNNNKTNRSGLSDNAKTLLNSILSEKDDKDIEEYRQKILFRKEFIKENITFGVVCIKKNTLESAIKYDSYIITIDNDDNILDNIMLKRFDDKEKALKYANELSEMVEDNNIVNLVSIIDKTLEK